MLRRTLSAVLPICFKNYINAVMNKIFFAINKPRVLKFYKSGKRYFISNTVDITHWEHLEMGNNVFIWHFTILDTFNKIKIGNDCQIGTRVGIFTHSSHHSIRYYNENYNDVYFDSHKGRVKGSVEIGDNTFVGANSILMPNTKIGKGCIVAGFSYVQGDFPDFSMIAGNPAKVVGDVRKTDYRFLQANPELADSYLEYFGFTSMEQLKESFNKNKI